MRTFYVTVSVPNEDETALLELARDSFTVADDAILTRLAVIARTTDDGDVFTSRPRLTFDFSASL